MAAPDPTRKRLRNFLMLMALVALSLACTALLKYRMHHTGSWRYGFLTWNLLLAWTPLAAAVAADAVSQRRSGARALLLLPLGLLWLAFLPNAPYLCTDLIHLVPLRGMPFWYDQAMLVAYGVTGVLIGVASMLLMHDVVERVASRALAWLATSSAAVLAAFGVYLGRFERLNSWELFSRPALVLKESRVYIVEPLTHSHALEWTLFFSAFLLITYICVFGVAEEGSRLLLAWGRRYSPALVGASKHQPPE
ncbi:MAG TPA: DUF1361 domain-containing protein [Dehalococcoidia bacterium]